MRAPALLAALLTGCSGVNPLGFWDITRLDLTYQGETQTIEDLGTFEMGELGGGGIVTRYRLLDPTLVAGGYDGDTGGWAAEEGSWFVPLTQPDLHFAPSEGAEKNSLSFIIGQLRVVDAPIEKYRGATMQVWEEEANLGQAVPISARFYLQR